MAASANEAKVTKRFRFAKKFCKSSRGRNGPFGPIFLYVLDKFLFFSTKKKLHRKILSFDKTLGDFLMVSDFENFAENSVRSNGDWKVVNGAKQP